MVKNELQYRIHQGDREAFAELFNLCGRDAYLSALALLSNKAAATEATKRAFMALREELLSAPGPIDVEARLTALIEKQAAARKAEEPREEAPLWPDEAPAEAPAQPTADDAEIPGAEDELPPLPPEMRTTMPQNTRRSMSGILWALVAVMLLLLIWVAAGVLMNLSLVPYGDWGYSWFNAHIFPLFGGRV